MKIKEIKYVYENTPFGWAWQLDIDGYRPLYPCGELKGLMQFVRQDLDILLDKMNSNDNRGLAFHACGYNGQAQQSYIDEWEKLGVCVF